MPFQWSTISMILNMLINTYGLPFFFRSSLISSKSNVLSLEWELYLSFVKFLPKYFIQVASVISFSAITFRIFIDRILEFNSFLNTILYLKVLLSFLLLLFIFPFWSLEYSKQMVMPFLKQNKTKIHFTFSFPKWILVSALLKFLSLNASIQLVMREILLFCSKY